MRHPDASTKAVLKHCRLPAGGRNWTHLAAFVEALREPRTGPASAASTLPPRKRGSGPVSDLGASAASANGSAPGSASGSAASAASDPIGEAAPGSASRKRDPEAPSDPLAPGSTYPLVAALDWSAKQPRDHVLSSLCRLIAADPEPPADALPRLRAAWNVRAT